LPALLVLQHITKKRQMEKAKSKCNKTNLVAFQRIYLTIAIPNYFIEYKIYKNMLAGFSVTRLFLVKKSNKSSEKVFSFACARGFAKVVIWISG
jgi:hypothetical protein